MYPLMKKMILFLVRKQTIIDEELKQVFLGELDLFVDSCKENIYGYRKKT